MSEVFDMFHIFDMYCIKALRNTLIYIYASAQAMQERASRSRKPATESAWHVPLQAGTMLAAARDVQARTAASQTVPLLPEPTAVAAMLRRVFTSEFPHVDAGTVFVQA
jgi:hypothetical protein